MRLTVSATQLSLFADSRPVRRSHVTQCCDSVSSVAVWLQLGEDRAIEHPLRLRAGVILYCFLVQNGGFLHIFA